MGCLGEVRNGSICISWDYVLTMVVNSDMKDRISMREHMQETVAWEDAETMSFTGSSSLRAPSDRKKAPAIQNPGWDVGDKTSLCRSMRGFIAFKAVSGSHPMT